MTCDEAQGNFPSHGRPNHLRVDQPRCGSVGDASPCPALGTNGAAFLRHFIGPRWSVLGRWVLSAPGEYAKTIVNVWPRRSEQRTTDERPPIGFHRGGPSL